MSTRRENAIKKIVKLERELEGIVTEKGVESRIREINRLQSVYHIDMYEIERAKRRKK